jgi:hypothetical protein
MKGRALWRSLKPLKNQAFNSPKGLRVLIIEFKFDLRVALIFQNEKPQLTHLFAKCPHLEYVSWYGMIIEVPLHDALNQVPRTAIETF